MDILFSILLLGGLALLFAALILVITKKFAIKENIMATEIGKLLSNANCGGCGYAGCAAFAEALLNGKAKLSDCPSTSKENKKLIANIIGSDGNVGDTFKVVVACSGGSDCKDKYEYQGYGDCMSIELLAGGRKACPTGCIGSNKCATACGYGAITLCKNGYPVVNKELCTVCGHCVFTCPKKIIKRIPSSAKVFIACSSHDKGKDIRAICKNGCIGCGICKKFCPESAIELVDNLPIIDYTKCNGCLTCVNKCPAKTIKEY